ncbi:MAG: hypothetical protein JNK05_30645 [Myxococcales bacterium]|nr:hypothetical protein [Myxococcales bacterium]
MQLLSSERPERSLFWTAPASTDSELVTEDPLGLDYIAQQVGLLLLPTFTTRSTRAQAFAMVLYGLALADRAIDHYGLPATDEERRMRFESWERFWALATLEYRRELPRGDWDTMRGIRGVKSVWKATGEQLPIRFKMISRQQELGHLGAYLVPLRRAGLVADGTLRPTPAAHEIIEHFWDERRDRDHVGRYDDFALAALDPARSLLERKYGGLTLSTIGERSRLLSLIERKRSQQQRRLDAALFRRRVDPSTQRVAEVVEHATLQQIVASKAVLDAAIDGRLGVLEPSLLELFVTARAFGDFMQQVVNAFDRVYDRVSSSSWVIDSSKVASEVFNQRTRKALASASSRLLDAPRVSDIRRLPAHGAACLQLATQLFDADGPRALQLLLDYHNAVQKERRRGFGWLREDGSKLVLAVDSYTAYPNVHRFPSFKLDVVRTLLTDLGRLPFNHATAQGESA